jgi:hypothetical protein
LPLNPDEPVASARRARLGLYMRSHWVRMPPVLLARHLARKALRRRHGEANWKG